MNSKKIRSILVATLSALTLVVLAGLLSACGTSAKSSAQSTQQVAQSTTPASSAQPAVAPETVNLVVKSDDEHGKMGSDGNWHDAFLPADFTVHAGAVVTVTVQNYDNSPHSFSSSDLNVNQVIKAGSEDTPSTTTFTFTASKAGSYTWKCDPACDPWAMNHDGFMRGVVTVL